MRTNMGILVTVGAGFIGSNFVHHLLDRTNHSVVTIDALTYAGSKENLQSVLDNPRQEFVEGNTRDTNLVEDFITDVDAVVNFAASPTLTAR